MVGVGRGLEVYHKSSGVDIGEKTRNKENQSRCECMCTHGHFFSGSFIAGN
jgi:hypothetical protein